MTLTLPEVVQTISTAISSSNELWHDIDYPEESELEQTESFLARITEEAGEFLKAEEDLAEMVRQHVKEKHVLVESLSAELEVDFQITAQSACTQFDQLCRFEKLFEEEKQLRIEQLYTINEELEICCEDANLSFVSAQSIRQSDIVAAQEEVVAVKTKLRPQYDELSRISAQVKHLIITLDRTSENKIIQLCMEGKSRISHIGELRTASEQLETELEERKREIALTSEEILSIEAVLEQANTFLAISEVENTLGNAMLSRVPFLLLDNDFSDGYYADLMREFNDLHDMLHDNKPLIVKELIVIKTELLREINPLYVNYETDGDILQLQHQIELLRSAKEMVQPIIENVEEFNDFELMGKELAAIEKDTTRFTSRGREGVKMREREEFLKKELGNNFPKAIAALKFKLDRLQDEFRDNKFEISLAEVLGKDYYLDISKILEMQSKTFAERYEEFLGAFGRQRLALSKRDATNEIKTPRRLSQSAGLRKSKLGGSKSGVTPIIKKRE